MAGNAKPNIPNLGIEASFKINGMQASQGSGGTIDNCGLFNGNSVNEWNTSNVFYWGESTNFLEIDIKQDCNIWRCGTSSWATSNGTLNVFLYNESTSTYDNITSVVEQTTTAITNSSWEKTFTKLKKGKYKFTTGSGLRLDSEWYIESLSLFLLKSNEKIYSIKQEYYNNETKMYNTINESDINLEEQGFSIEELLEEVTINEETFKPIDKFNSFQLVSDSSKDICVNAIKSTKELLVGKTSFSTKIASNIDYFKLDDNSSDNIRLAFSIDSGTTWKTWNVDDLAFEDLSITIPNKEYSALSQEELAQWNNARDDIYTNGVSPSVLKTLDFNSLNMTNIKFAYVLNATDANTLDKMQNLIWQFDSKGTMVKMGTDECKVALTDDGIVITPTSNQEMMKINILNGLVDMGRGTNVNPATSTDIQTILNKGW